MGSTAQDLRASKKGSAKRGSTDNTSRLAGLSGAKSEKTGTADWGGADPRWVAAIVILCTSQGMEVGFVLTKDHGAHGLKLYDFSSGERATLWFNGDADLNAELERVYYELGGA